jgi:hypothetical protein
MKIVLFLLFGLFSIPSSFSQSINNNPVTDFQVKNAIHLYNHFTDGNAPIFNGPQYIYYIFKMEGSPYFVTGNYSKGWVEYNRQVYNPVSIFYDIERNQLVLLNADSLSNIVMHNEFIDSFHLSGHTFISLKEDFKQNLYNTGFYDLLYNGHVQLLARRIKAVEDKIVGSELIRIFYTRDHFYIHKAGIYYLVSNKKDVFRLLADKKHEIKKMMRKKHLKLRGKTFESSLEEVTAFYDQITH